MQKTYVEHACIHQVCNESRNGMWTLQTPRTHIAHRSFGRCTHSGQWIITQEGKRPDNKWCIYIKYGNGTIPKIYSKPVINQNLDKPRLLVVFCLFTNHFQIFHRSYRAPLCSAQNQQYFATEMGFMGEQDFVRLDLKEFRANLYDCLAPWFLFYVEES